MDRGEDALMRWNEGDKSALGELFQIALPDLSRIATAIAGPTAIDAGDLVNNLFIQLTNQSEGKKPKHGSMQEFLSASTSLMKIDLHNLQQNMTREAATENPALLKVEEMKTLLLEKQELMELIQELPTHARKLLRTLDETGYSIEETAQKTGTEIGDLAKGLTTALAALAYQAVTRGHKINFKHIEELRNDFEEAAFNANAVAEELEEERRTYQIALKEIVEEIRELTPDLVQHLRNHHEQIEIIPPAVLEHLVAEVFSSWGWDEVRMVGRSPDTSADILAGYRVPGIGSRVRFFVEVKRHKSKIGIEIIEQVLGAMFAERPRFGWHAAMIISTGGFKKFRNYTRHDLSLKGIELKDKNDLVRWLSDYKPNKNGLWLPAKLP